jgi:pyruvate dehydrogenase E1 component beta subunit
MMRKLSFADAIEDVLAQMMEKYDDIIVMGEDIHTIRLNLFARFGKNRIRSTPISESSFVGAAVAAAMSGLRPIVEIMLVDFVGVAMDALLNHAAKTESFSGGKWKVPLVVRAACGGGYGDGGQHEQTLWGWFSHIPGLSVAVPSTPADAGGLFMSAILHDGPVIFLEHKLLADYWLEYMGIGGRKTVQFDIPAEGVKGPVPDSWEPIPLGKSKIIGNGTDLTFISIGVNVHHCIEAASKLKDEGIETTIIDLRTTVPLDCETIINTVNKSKRVLVVDEDYQAFGLSGEIAAILLEAGLIEIKFSRIGTKTTIPYNHELEKKVLPNTKQILKEAKNLVT